MQKSTVNSKRFNFGDFTERNYIKSLEAADLTHEFAFYDEYNRMTNPILWRHDVDISVHRALWMAKAEFDVGAKATYFIMLHSCFYNILEKEIQSLLKNIHSYGHHLSLHFDPNFYLECDNPDALDFFIAKERKILESIIDQPIVAFSFHNPTPNILQFNRASYGELINTYGSDIRDQFVYCSDSNGRWRDQSILESIKANSRTPLQILTHPEWWQKTVMSPRERFIRCIEGRAHNNIVKNDIDLKLYGTSYINW